MANPGEPILYERFQANNKSTFEPGIVVSATGSTCVNVYDENRDTVHTRHKEQVKQPPQKPREEAPLEATSGAPELTNSEVIEDAELPELSSNETSNIDPDIPSHSGLVTASGRPRRQCGPPARYKDFATGEEM